MTPPNFPPTASETPTCPPHYWHIDPDYLGTCLKCGLVKDHKPPRQKASRSLLALQTASKGGKKSLGRRKKHGKDLNTNANL